VKHVSEEQLVAYRDGEDDPNVREHLASCEKCQQKFDDSRWSLSLQRLVAAPGDGKHPSDEELTAFWDNALSGEASRRVQRHLRSCNRCLAVYRRMRGATPKLAYASPAPDLVRRVRRQFSSRPSPFDLGELWLRWIGGTLQLTREPGEMHSFDLHACRLVGDVGDQAASAMPHPASARARSQRLGKKPRPKPGKPVRLEAGNLSIELRVVDETGLGIHLSWGDTDQPATGVRLLLETDEQGEKENRTNRHGAAWFPLSRGSMRLWIQTRTPVRLQINSPV
jgi:hypothetical protein